MMIKWFCFLLILLGGCSISLSASVDKPAGVDKEVYVIHNGNKIIIGNEFLAREFSVRDGKVHTQAITNKRTDTVPIQIIPETGSEEFIIRTLSSDSTIMDIRASELLLDRFEITGEGKNGKVLTFYYKSFRCGEVDWQVNMVITLQEGKHYMRKYLAISVPDSQYRQARIDYIDSESLRLPQEYTTWTHPEMEQGVGGGSGYYISLGQPVYIQALFFGLEFPAAESEITKDNVAHIRYYSGKSFAQLELEQRLENGVFSTWKEVIGATRSTDMDVIQSDFFAYIYDISVPVDFRIQYNSWYDFMMDINENNILKSFLEVERGLTQNGVRPIDSYVVDDGWNAYGPWTKENTVKFWSFNSKFPNDLSTPSGLSHRLSSDFGLWLGPRGGYGYNSAFAKFLEENGNGKWNRNSNDICTNHKVYLQKLKAFFLDCQQRFDINYWKLDGFMVRPPQPDSLGNYISGGYQGMYYVTEHWERWIDILQAMREQRGAKKDDFWINLTCYVNPSPWFLQWVNSVWMQNSQDMGRLNVRRPSQVDQLLSYRDDRYFDFVRTRAFQFPLVHLYNHDPIYGNTAKLAGTMNDEEFCTYLMMMATRGTAFWELYYSYKMMNEGNKWAINADVLHWIDEHFNILKHAKLIGNTPAQGSPYGYSAWEGQEGIVSVRNPSDQPKEFTIQLDRTIGMPEGLKGLYRTTVWAYLSNVQVETKDSLLFDYGERITLNLQPGEVRIWKFTTNPDKKAAALRILKTAFPVIQITNSDSVNQEIPVTTGISGCGDFNISFRLRTDKAAVFLLRQGKDISVDLDTEGCLMFSVGGVKVVSKELVNDNNEYFVSLCREKNGMLKIYLDGELEDSAYDAAIINPRVEPVPVTINTSLGNGFSQIRIINHALDYRENMSIAR